MQLSELTTFNSCPTRESIRRRVGFVQRLVCLASLLVPAILVATLAPAEAAASNTFKLSTRG